MLSEHFRIWLSSVLLCAVASLPPQTARAQVANRPTLPAAMQRLLTWLPMDTETLVVAQSFQFPSSPTARDAARLNSKLNSPDFAFMVQVFALDGMFGRDNDKSLQTLIRTKADL